MNLLLDTHACLWFFWNDPRLSAKAGEIISNPGNRKLVSVASCWEIAIKVSLNKLDLGEPYQDFMHREIARNNFDLLPASLDHAAVVSTLPFHHRDPFDRLLIAQALWEQLPIASSDTAFDAYAVQRLW